MFAAADVVAVLLASSILARMGQSGRAQRLVQRLGAVVLVALGVRLALSRD